MLYWPAGRASGLRALPAKGFRQPPAAAGKVFMASVVVLAQFGWDTFGCLVTVKRSSTQPSIRPAHDNSTGCTASGPSMYSDVCSGNSLLCIRFLGCSWKP